MVPALLFRSGLCAFLGADGELLELARQYLTVVFAAAPVFVLYHILSACVRTDGAPRLAAAASVTVIAANLALDLLFMAVLKWSIVGASAALCIGEGLGVLVLLTHFLRRDALLRLGLRFPGWDNLRAFVGSGFGIGSAQIFQAIVMLVFNAMLLADRENGVTHVAVFGVIYTMSTVPQAVFDGAGSALSTVVSILTGERDSEGMLTVLKLGFRIVCAAGGVLALAFLVGAEGIMGFFGLEGEAVASASAAVAFRIYGASVLLMGAASLAIAFWQSVGRARLAAWMSIVRNFALLLRQSAAYVRSKCRPARAVYERYYTIQTGSVTQIASDLERLCDEWEIGPKQAFLINLMAEELLINIIKFGLKDARKERYIAIRVMDNEGEYIMRIRDNVRSYNPFDSCGDEIDNAVIQMIRSKTKYYSYQRKLIFNYLYLIL